MPATKHRPASLDSFSLPRMETPTSIELLGSSLTTKGESVLRALDDRCVVALATGAAESLNLKQWLCEDSVAVHRLGDGSLLAAVADAHFGGYAGEAMLEGLVDRFESTAPGTILERLTQTMRLADAALHEHRPAGDTSESTALFVHVEGRTVSWVSVGDSYAFLCGVRARILNQESFEAWPRYVGAQSLEAIAPRGAAFDHDQVQAKPGEVLLLATDGIETRSSGIELAEITPVLRRPGTLQQRLQILQALCDRTQTGGGKDNLGLVAIEFAPDAT